MCVCACMHVCVCVCVCMCVYAGIPSVLSVDKAHFQECLLETLQEMFGPQCTDKLFQRDRLLVVVDDKQAVINLESHVSSHL